MGRTTQAVTAVAGVNTNGRFDRLVDVRRISRPAGCMLFHPGHDHWHFDASARYTLMSADAKTVLAAQDKVSFCLRDSRLAPAVAVPAGSAVPAARSYGECDRDNTQGISAGWADVYRARLPGQALRLPPNLPDGVYCLHIEADPNGLLQESRDDDNASVRTIRITRTRVALAVPASCPLP
jgi:hypothetical protein